MKDTLMKLRMMLNMKTSLVKALQKDLEHALIKIGQRDARIESLQMELDTRRAVEEQLSIVLFRTQFENEDLKFKLEQAEKDAEWWHEMDEDEDYQASLEVATSPGVPFDIGTTDEYEVDDTCFEEE